MKTAQFLVKEIQMIIVEKLFKPPIQMVGTSHFSPKPSISYRLERTIIANVQIKTTCFLCYISQYTVFILTDFLYLCSPQENLKLTFLIIQLRNENAFGQVDTG